MHAWGKFISLLICTLAIGLQARELTPVSHAGVIDITLPNGNRATLAGVRLLKGKQTQLDALMQSWAVRDIHWQSVGTTRYGLARVVVYDAKTRQSLQQALIDHSVVMAYSHRHFAELQRWLDHPSPCQFHQAQAEDVMCQWCEITGTVRQVHSNNYGSYLNFGDNWREDFTVFIPPDTSLSAPESFVGKQVKVRGYVHAYYGPRITLHNAAMLRMVPANEP